MLMQKILSSMLIISGNSRPLFFSLNVVFLCKTCVHLQYKIRMQRGIRYGDAKAIHHNTQIYLALYFIKTKLEGLMCEPRANHPPKYPASQSRHSVFPAPCNSNQFQEGYKKKNCMVTAGGQTTGLRLLEPL
jgi:hypothetical protein